MPTIDLRSDTVTKPTPEMRRAMAEAEVGDDVFEDDPTVRGLEERAAELLGKEAGLFVASGSMGNLVAQMVHLGRGEEAILGRWSHIVVNEAAGHAVVVGASVRALDERPDGTMALDEIRAAFRDPSDIHEPITGMIGIENTNMYAMGLPLTPEFTADVGRIARESGVALHVDGARFFNAAVALGVRPADLAGPADTVSFCLSKGLACPVGSVVVGTKAVIASARRARKLLGGGMRQVGVLAAPGLIALRDGPAGMIERLADDHTNARLLAEGLSEFPGIDSPGGTAQPAVGPFDPGRVRTNIVVFRVDRKRDAFLAALENRGVLMMAYPQGQIRAVTHYGVERADVEATIKAVRESLVETAGQVA